MKNKWVYLARRNPALEAEAFPQAWREHSALGGSTPEVRKNFEKITQCSNARDPALGRMCTWDYDGVNLITLNEGVRNRDVIASVNDALLADELRVFDSYVRTFTLTAKEEVLRDLDRSPYVLVDFLRTREGDGPSFSRAVAQLHRDHDETFGSAIRRHVVNHVAPKRPPAVDFDAVTELWFDSIDDARGFLLGDAYSGMFLSRRAELADVAATVSVLARVTHARPPVD